jgi:hypothetical protein
MVAVFIPDVPRQCPNVKLKYPSRACMKNPALSIWLVATGCESKLLVIGISVAIGKEQGLECWSTINLLL